MAQPNVTIDAATWKFQKSYIERLMDHAALTSAHPDDTLILAGPARYGYTSTDPGTEAFVIERCLPIGMVQSFNVMLQKPSQPMMAIGSGRNFFVSGKSQGNAQIARLFCNGRNLLRVLYTNAVQAELNVSDFDDPACAGTENGHFFMNLDSELFLVPFGMACFFRDKTHNALGAFYLELCMLNSYAIAFNAGQNMILENVSMLFDRALPIGAGTFGTADAGSLKESDLAQSGNGLVGVPTSAIYPGLDTAPLK